MSTKRSIVNHVHRTSLILAASLLASSLATGARADAPAGVPASAVPSATVLSTSAPSASVALTGPQVGAPAPAFALQTLDGKTIGLESYRGKTLVVNVWATWCPPCREEMPVLAAAARKASPGVVFLGVDTTERA